MFSPWLATFGAIFPIGPIVLRPPAWRSRRPQSAARAAKHPPATARRSNEAAPLEARSRPQRTDTSSMCVVPYLPSDDVSPHLRAHPRIRNPFRAFPRRGADLVGLMEGCAGHD